MAKIGDYVISDAAIASVEKESHMSIGYQFVGCGMLEGGYYGSVNYAVGSRWFSKSTNRLATIKDLEIFAYNIRNCPTLVNRPEVKEFMRKATIWILTNS